MTHPADSSNPCFSLAQKPQDRLNGSSSLVKKKIKESFRSRDPKILLGNAKEDIFEGYSELVYIVNIGILTLNGVFC